MSKEILLKTNNLCKYYKNNKGIRNINLNVEKGDVYGFLGPNGSGKTTTIRTILNLIRPDSGSAEVGGYNIYKEFEKAIVNVGAIVETPKFYEYLSGKKNLKLIAGLYNDISKERVDEVLDMVGLSSRSDDKVRTYSLGMKQRLGIGRALLQNPNLVILDEPTNGLDPQGMKEVRELISKLSIEKDITFFISTHLLNEVEQICNKVGILKEGNLLLEGYVKDLLCNDTEIVEVITKNIDKAKLILNNIDFIKNIEIFNSKMTLEIDKGYFNELNTILIKKDIKIDSIILKNKTLESFFFETIKGGKLNA